MNSKQFMNELNNMKNHNEFKLKQAEEAFKDKEAQLMKENEALIYIVDKLKGDVNRLEKEVDEMHQVRQAVK